MMWLKSPSIQELEVAEILWKTLPAGKTEMNSILKNGKNNFCDLCKVKCMDASSAFV